MGKAVIDSSQRSKAKDFFDGFRNSFLATQTTIGIDVGDGYIKIVQLQKSAGGYLLTDYRVRAIPFKLKDNPKEKNRFVKEFINEFISQSRIKTTLGRLSVKGAGIFTFSFALPPLSEKDLRGAVGIELKKRLPFQLDFKNISFNYFITERFEDESPTVMVTCIAADNNVLDNHLDFLKSFGLRPVVINTNADAVGNLLHAIGEERHVAVMDMGYKQSYLNFFKGNALQFSREIPVGGEHLTLGILKALTPLEGSITYEDAEAFKKQCGIPMQEEAAAEFYTDFGAVKGNQIATALRPTLERLITELTCTVTFYFRTYKLENLDMLYLTGGASRVKSIERFLSANLTNISVKGIEKLNPLKAIKGWLDVGVFRQDLVMEEAAPHLATAFGLCVDKGGEVNLVPQKEKIEQKAIFVMLLARITFPLIFLSVIGFYAFSWARSILYKTLAGRAEDQIEEIEPMIRKIEEYRKKEREFQARKTLLNQAVGRQPLWWGVLKELSIITPAEVTLHNLTVQSGRVPKKMEIVGVVVSEYTNLDLAISQYTLGLSESPFFTNVELVSSERDVYSPVPRALFQITCDLKI